MGKTLEIEVRVLPTIMSEASSRALDHVLDYDWILFTSKNAVSFFSKELKKRKITLSSDIRIAAVGPETAAALRAAGFSVTAVPEQFTVRDMLTSLGTVKGQRILFPRSSVAPHEPIKILRAQGARVTAVPLYYPTPVTLSLATKRALLSGSYAQLYFKSPSGIKGFLDQLSAPEKKCVRDIPALCIGLTTAIAAKKAGFRNVSQGVL